MHDGSHIGTVCDSCGTHHRVIEALNPQPMTRAALNSFQESDTFVFAQGIGWMSPGLAGVEVEDTEPPHDEVTEEIVLGTETTVLLLSLYEPGWVVENEIEPEEGETVKEVANDVWMEASNMHAEALHKVVHH